jgi:hypothetical protein
MKPYAVHDSCNRGSASVFYEVRQNVRFFFPITGNAFDGNKSDILTFQAEVQATKGTI